MPSFDNDNKNEYKPTNIDWGIGSEFNLFYVLLYAFIPIVTIIHIVLLFREKKVLKAILWIVWMFVFWGSLIAVLSTN